MQIEMGEEPPRRHCGQPRVADLHRRAQAMDHKHGQHQSHRADVALPPPAPSRAGTLADLAAAWLLSGQPNSPSHRISELSEAVETVSKPGLQYSCAPPPAPQHQHPLGCPGPPGTGTLPDLGARASVLVPGRAEPTRPDGWDLRRHHHRSRAGSSSRRAGQTVGGDHSSGGAVRPQPKIAQPNPPGIIAEPPQ